MENKRLTDKNTTFAEKETLKMFQQEREHWQEFSIRMGRIENKLKELEDLLESYNVKDLNELDKLLGMATTYEELSKQLGCPLEVLFRALKDGIYHNEKFEHPVLILDEDSFKKNNFSLLVVGTIVYLKEYKITWWLKEDKSE